MSIINTQINIIHVCMHTYTFYRKYFHFKCMLVTFKTLDCKINGIRQDVSSFPLMKIRDFEINAFSK